MLVKTKLQKPNFTVFQMVPVPALHDARLKRKSRKASEKLEEISEKNVEG